MKKISIPTVIQDPDIVKTTKYKKKNDSTSSVVVFQHNNLVEARYSLTLQEKRLILWLISKVRPDEEDFKKHELSVQEFMDLMQLKGHANYKELQKITLGLMKKILVIKNPEEKKLIQVAWINYAHYEEGSGRIQISFSDAMKPFLLHLKSRFTAIAITDLMQFTSIHAIRVYELLKQHERIGERTLTIDDIKACCGVTGKLKQYVDFENKLLLIAQREINDKSDIEFTFERKKTGRKITAIKFIIRKNRQHLSNIEHHDETRELGTNYLYYALSEFGLLQSTIKKYIKIYSEQDITNAIKAVDRQIAKGTVRNPKAMLTTAIQEKWHPEKYRP